jgi:hypothetical protein
MAAAEIARRVDALQFADVAAPIRDMRTGAAGRLWIARRGTPVRQLTGI